MASRRAREWDLTEWGPGLVDCDKSRVNAFTVTRHMPIKTMIGTVKSRLVVQLPATTIVPDSTIVGAWLVDLYVTVCDDVMTRCNARTN
jgi:hypothetical protein